MIKIIMHGCNGQMGRVVAGIVAQDTETEIVAGIDPVDAGANPFPVFPNIGACKAEADVVIDFAAAAAVDDLLDYCEANRLPVVLCTTGLSEAQLAHVKETAQHTPVLKSANMSLGINTIMKLLKQAVNVFAPEGYDIEIVEKHHNRKVDAPSGTALALADAMNEELDNRYAYKFDRSRERMRRPKQEIGISAVRGGTIVGEHEVIFAGVDEVIEIKHTAYSKAVFAKGAVAAAKFLAGKAPGMYDMHDVIEAQ